MTTLRGRVVTPTEVIDDAVVVIANSTIVSIEAITDDPATASGELILPGLVDMHCHGGGGASFTAANEQDVVKAAVHHLAHGTTTLIASAVTDTPEAMTATISCLAAAADQGVVAGIHIEGPFLSPQRCGAQDPAQLQRPDVALAAALLDAGRGHVCVMTIAPELPGASSVLELLRERGVRAAVGHTVADARTVRDTLARPEASVVTHLFNGMPPIHHRDPGPAMAAMVAARDGDATVELIADGVHVADETVAAVWSLVGGDHIALVTDAMAAAGLPDGNFMLGPQQVTVRDGVATLTHGDSLAGGTSRMIDLVRRQVAAGLNLVEVVRAASHTPARVIGAQTRVGGLIPGLRADLVVTNADLHPQRVMRAGEWVA